MLIVAFCNADPCDLWIVKPQASFKESWFLLPILIGVIGNI